MGFSAKQLQALKRNPSASPSDSVRACLATRELSYIEGWGTRSRRQTASLGLMAGAARPWTARAARKTRIPGLCAKVRIPCSRGAILSRRPWLGEGRARRGSPRIALKAAKPMPPNGRCDLETVRLELYRRTRTCKSPLTATRPPTAAFGSHPDDTTPIPRPSHYYGATSGLDD